MASAEFAASTMVDFAAAGVTGLAAAAGVAVIGMGLTAAGIGVAASAPVWLTIGLVGLAGAGLYAGLNHFVDMEKLKQDVADGLRAWPGIFNNVGTITRALWERGDQEIDITREGPK